MKRITIWLNPKIFQRIKVAATMKGINIGEMLELLINFYEYGGEEQEAKNGQATDDGNIEKI